MDPPSPQQKMDSVYQEAPNVIVVDGDFDLRTKAKM